MPNNNMYGFFERGTITEKQDKKYKVESLDRVDIKTDWLTALPQHYHEDDEAIDVKFEVGDSVYFVSFRDGTGIIIDHFTM